MTNLLLSAYDADSHRRWREGVVAHCDQCEWTSLQLPARYFNWRIRGNSLSWALGERDTLIRPYQLILATSMVDLSTLKGLVPELSRTPSILYFHENQFAYPVSEHQQYALEPRMVNLYSALAADALVFNTDYNRESFLLGVDKLLSKMPDAVPKGVTASLSVKSQVLAVPLEPNTFRVNRAGYKPPLEIVWNHRWEYDKGPQKLLGCLQALPPQLQLKLHIIGQQFRREPEAFSDIHQLLTERNWLGHWGYLDNPSDYMQLLQRCHLVLSTALHDFQGLSVLEAVAAGCIPLVPDRLAYRELFPPSFRYTSHFENNQPQTHGAVESESAACAAKIIEYYERLASDAELPAPPNLQALSWSQLQARYSALFAEFSRPSGGL
ncbi:tRNA-queuosine alpha-mannosyltransferase domain-containing protein [Teredinibacter haidensis]|uniref:tRNA-queuosine alpha-mannosyltransferase domain-containing protein n=1 Tax=Teredinibacter haidensis TaxID=2731755 RepID=UPI0009490CFC|nr:DUF3524 domain-containing protein [Teredinibacter haidensis]